MFQFRIYNFFLLGSTLATSQPGRLKKKVNFWNYFNNLLLTTIKQKMKNNLQFAFKVDKTKNTVFLNKEYPTEITLVWDAFTKQKILDKWWLPEPWTSQTKYMGFQVGGPRFYAMVSPEGKEHWLIQNFTSINSTKNFKFFYAYTNKNGTGIWLETNRTLKRTNDKTTTT